MVYVINQLPQNISGTSTSGDQPVYFYKEQLDQTQVQEITLNQKWIFSSIDHACHYSYSTDHPGNPLPISIIVGGGKATFFYLDAQQGIVSKQANWIEAIPLSNGLQFANIGLIVFIQYGKYFYSCDLSQENVVISQRTDIYNTVNGTESGTSCENCMLGILFEKYLASMGGTQRGIRFFYSYEEENTFKIKFANYYNTGNRPYGYGTCLVIAINQILGGLTYYSRSTGYNVLYICTEDIQNHTISVEGLLQTLQSSSSSSLSADDGTKRRMVVWNGQLVYYARESSTGIASSEIYAYKGSYFERMGNSYNYGLCFALSSKEFYLYFGYSTNPTVYRGTIQISGDDLTGNLSLLYTLDANSIFCKIPGMNAYYYDGDKTNNATKPIIRTSYDPYATLFISPGSNINGVAVKEHGVTFPKSGDPITIQVSANAINFHLLQDRGNGTGGML